MSRPYSTEAERIEARRKSSRESKARCREFDRQTNGECRMNPKCDAEGCKNIPMPNGRCGVHDEMHEDGIAYTLRRERGRPRKAPLYPVSERRPYCIAETKKGTEHCQNYATAGSEYCGIHRAFLAKVGAA